MIGEVVGAFRLVAPAGEGGHATVWRALHPQTALPFALKLLRRPDAPAARQALLAELATVAALDHPGVVRVVDHGWLEPGGALPEGPWLAMAWAGRGAMPVAALPTWEVARDATRRVLQALAYAHARGVLHRDVKPSNVLCDDLGHAWLADFGLSGVGASAGTPAWMAPEQVRGRSDDLGPWTDLYALGGTLWTWVAGGPPFGLAHPPDVLRLAQLTWPLPALEPTIATPAGLSEFLAVLLARDPKARFSCAADALHALEALGPPDRPASSPREAAEATSTATWTEGLDLPVEEAPSEAPRVAPAARPFPVDWRTPPSDPLPAAAVGAALRLLPYRAPPEIGRSVERDALWRALGAVASAGSSRAIGLEGAPGTGRRHLAGWLATTAAELGATGGDRRPEVCVLDGTGGWPEVAVARALRGSRPTLVVVPTGSDATPRGLDSVRVGPLARDELVELLERFAGLERPAAARIGDRADGNPGAALQLVRALHATGALVATPTGVRLDGALPDDPVPEAAEPPSAAPIRAAEWWLARGRPDEAVRCLAGLDPSGPLQPGCVELWRRAVALAPEAAPRSVRARFALRWVYQLVGHGAVDEVEVAVRDALELADGDPEVRAVAWTALAAARMYQGRAEEGWEIADAASREPAPGPAAAVAWSMRGQLAARTGRWDEALVSHRRSVDLRDEPQRRAAALGGLACSAVAAGRVELAREAVAEADRVWPGGGPQVDRARGLVAMADGDLEAAEVALRRSIVAMRRAGQAPIDLPLLPLARLALATERWSLARDLAREALGAAAGAGHAPDTVGARVVLVVASIALGAVDDARAQLDAVDRDVLAHLVVRGDRSVGLDRLLGEAADRAPPLLRSRIGAMLADLAAPAPPGGRPGG